jgi:hypothetical protein
MSLPYGMALLSGRVHSQISIVSPHDCVIDWTVTPYHCWASQAWILTTAQEKTEVKI